MKADAVVKEYVKRISDDDLAYLGIRFKQSLCGDTGAIAQKLSEDEEIDRWLSASTSADEWFEMLDVIGEQIKIEYNRRIDEEEQQEKRQRKKFYRRDAN